MRTATNLKEYNWASRKSLIKRLMIHSVITIFILVWTSNLFSQGDVWGGTEITVSSAGSADCNGVYEMMAYDGAHNYYLKDFPNGNILFYFLDSKWYIGRADTSVSPPWPILTNYYCNDAQTTNPPGSGWYSLPPDGTDPAPTLTGDGVESGTDVSETSIQIPKVIILNPAYPNPFNPETIISYYLSENTYVKLIIIDIMGHTVRELFEGTQNIGNYHMVWNGKYSHGTVASSGTYFIVLKTANDSKIRKMQLLR